MSKRYPVFATERERLVQALWPKPREESRDVWALRDVGFEVKRGEAMAVIGRNGSGKSTLLQIIAGTLTPSAGDVRVAGRVSALLELGSGFNPEYSGRDNVVLNGLLLGLSREQILGRFDEIAAFAEIGDAMDRPVKTYSSGMIMRLAFAVQVLTDPEILIVDEALSVGDFFFQQKCFRYIRALREKGTTLLFVSHDMASVRDLCRTGLFLKGGRVDYFGDNLEAIRRYLSDSGTPGLETVRDAAAECATLPAPTVIEQPLWTRAADSGPFSGKGRILAVGVTDASGRALQDTKIGEEIVFRVHFRAHSPEPLHVTLVVKNRYDQVLTSTGSYLLHTPLPRLEPNGEAIFEIRVRALLESGDYSFSVSLAQPDAHAGTGTIVDETPSLGPLRVTWNYASDIPPFYGMVGLPSTARFVVESAA